MVIPNQHLEPKGGGQVPGDFLPRLYHTGGRLLLVQNRGDIATTGAERVVDELVQVEEGVVEAGNGHCK